MTRQTNPTQTLTLGGGCHWCTEAVFDHLRGVSLTEQGFARSDPPHDAWSEAARVTFDPDTLPLAVLLDIHLRTHASTSDHSMRGKYRSAVYVEDDRETMRAMLAELQRDFDRPLVTQVLPLRAFRLNAPQFLDYYRTNPDRPFCRSYIDPKLAMLRKDYGRWVDPLPRGAS